MTASLAELLSSRQRDRTAMFALLDVIPDKLILQPDRLARCKCGVCRSRFVVDGKTVTALAALHDLHYLEARRRHARAALAQALGDAVGSYPTSGSKAYHRGSRGWRACPR